MLPVSRWLKAILLLSAIYVFLGTRCPFISLAQAADYSCKNLFEISKRLSSQLDRYEQDDGLSRKKTWAAVIQLQAKLNRIEDNVAPISCDDATLEYDHYVETRVRMLGLMYGAIEHELDTLSETEGEIFRDLDLGAATGPDRDVYLSWIAALKRYYAEEHLRFPDRIDNLLAAPSPRPT